jgi:hypothetical protein
MELLGGSSTEPSSFAIEASHSFLNLHTVEASGSSGYIELTGTITNGDASSKGLIEASTNGNAYILIGAGAVINNEYGVINGGEGGVFLDSGENTIGSAVIKQGTLEGYIDSLSGIPILDEAAISGTAGTMVNVDPGAGLALESTIVNNGVIVTNLHGENGSGANLYVEGTVTLEGTGTVELLPGGNFFGGFATKNELVNVSNTIEGQGDIESNGGSFVLYNKPSGTIEALGTPSSPVANLAINTGSAEINAGTIESSASATLKVYDTL